jgi:tetratricopeptide (TPR) repeat protein
MRKDEFGDSLAASMDYVLKHRSGAVLWVKIAAVALLVAGGIYFYARSVQNRAATALSVALTTYHAPVTPNPPASVTIETYRTNEEKYQKALEGFQAVADKYSWYATGRLARYYAALTLRELRQFPEAEASLKELAQGRDRRVASLAKVALASVYEQTDRVSEADALYKELEANPTETVPKTTALMARAELYRKTNPTEAATLYQQIQKDYPGTMAAERAGQMLGQLQP